MKGESSFVMGGIVMSLFLLIVLTMYAQTNISVNCPTSAEDINNQFNKTGIAGIVFGTSTLAAAMITPCSGIPYWFYIFTFLPAAIALAITLTPSIGGG
jgi:hypothetical protein